MLENYINDKFTIDELIRRSWNHKNSNDFIKFFDFIAKFDHYSRYNTMLVYLQNKAVTFFGGTTYWRKKFKRSIKDNARPYIILAPGGPIMVVYDIFDTVGKETPEEFLKKGLGRKPNEVKGKLSADVVKYAINMANHWGIKVYSKPLSYFNAGYITTIISNKLEINLKEKQTNEENFSVLIHELAHLFLGHTGHKELFYKNDKKKKITLLQRRIQRSAEELEAETVSFLICKKLGLETRAAEYMAAYITGEDDLLQFSYENVIKISEKIESMFVDTIKIMYPGEPLF